MSFTSKLCNPTPFEIKLPWHRGINIVIEAFGSTELSMQQMDDYRPGKPGSADVKSTLDYHGLFLLDSDRPYDNQALEALKLARKSKSYQLDSAVRNITDQRAAAGVTPNEEALDATLQRLGLKELKRKIDILTQAIEKFEAVVGDTPQTSTRPQFDPKRTIFVTDPPREFPSVAAMEFFLSQNPEIEAKHRALSNQNEPAAETKEPAKTTIQEIQSFVDSVSVREGDNA